MYEIGISSCYMEMNRAFFADYAKNNIQHIELSERHYDGFDYKKVSSLANEFGINIWSVHLPFVPFERFEISALDKTLRESTIAEFSEIIKKSAEIGVDKFVVHPSGEPIDNAEREDRKKYSRESLSILADVCEKNGAVICVEDLPRTCLGHSIDELKYLIADDDRIKICFDTNHITVEKPEEVICALGHRIVTLHVSDFDFMNERHWLPGEGKIDWKAVMAALKKVDYNGAFMYEMGFKCPATIFRNRDLTCADLKKNAEEIFSGSDLTVISTPKPNLGMWE